MAAAAEAHGFDFIALFGEMRDQLRKAMEELPEDQVLVVKDEYSLRLCRVQVALTARLDEKEDAVERSAVALRAAQESGDEPTIEAATAHNNRVLEQAIERNGLTPVVEALHALLFTKDAERAGL